MKLLLHDGLYLNGLRMNNNLHIAIIGAGPGGYLTAAEAAKRGLKVTLICDGPLGGTCLNAGCIPTKSLIHNCVDGKMGLDNAAEKMDEVTLALRSGIASLLRGVEVICGRASFVDAHTLKVTLCEEDAQDHTQTLVCFDKIIIATGSTAASLPVPGADIALSSDQLLKMKEVPSRMAIIGGGVIGLEFAGIFNALGCEVTVLEFCQGILPRFDTDMAKRLRQYLVRSGIKIIAGAAVTSLQRIDDATVDITYMLKDQELHLQTDVAVMAVGRRPLTDDLCLENAGVEYGRKGIPVDDRMRTNVPDIYAAGDVTGGIMLAHAASFQGLRALNDICGEEDSIDFSCIPAVVFTKPEFATVGLTEQQCRESGIGYTVHKSFYGANGKAVASDAADGICKVLADADGRIIGCHILGQGASDIIGEAATLVALKVTLQQARWIIHPHPTLCEVLLDAVRA